MCGTWSLAVALSAALLIAGCGASPDREPAPQPPSSQSAPAPPPPAPAPDHPAIRVSRPTPGQLITSPWVVAGEARGPWYFEASFPVKLLDERGEVIATAPAEARGEWMTPDFVPFVATLTFATTSRSGTLVLEKNNASGLAQHADSITVPVRF